MSPPPAYSTRDYTGWVPTSIDRSAPRASSIVSNAIAMCSIACQDEMYGSNSGIT